MATSFPVDPASYVHPAAGSFRNIRYGPSIHHRLNYYRNAAKPNEPHGLLVYGHGGGWGANEKTSTIEGSELMHILWGFVLDTDSYGTDDVVFDVASVEWRRQNQTNISPPALSTPYEATAEGTNPGTGPTAAPWFFPTFVDDLQRAIQFMKTHAARFGIDPDRVVAWGSSSGAHLALLSALAPSRRFMPADLASRLYDVTHTSRVRGVLNWFSPIDFNPWYMHFKLLAPSFGLTENSDANQRADMERLLLIPAADGTFPSTCEPTPICKAISPRHRIRAAWSDNLGLRIRSQYATYETTSAPGPTYSTIPPYVALGHEFLQLADLQAECDAVGMPHESAPVNPALHGGDIQIAWESTLQGTYDWLVDTVAV